MQTLKADFTSFEAEFKGFLSDTKYKSDKLIE